MTPQSDAPTRMEMTMDELVGRLGAAADLLDRTGNGDLGDAVRQAALSATSMHDPQVLDWLRTAVSEFREHSGTVKSPLHWANLAEDYLAANPSLLWSRRRRPQSPERDMTDEAHRVAMELEQHDAILTTRFDRFCPPCWQVWDGPGERLIAAFATRELLYAALPTLRTILQQQEQT